MKRISILSMAFLSALSFSGFAAEMVAPDGAVVAKGTNDKLLISSSASAKPRRTITVPRENFDDSFSRRMARNGWDLRDRSNRSWENFRKIVAREEMQSVQDEVNARFFETRRSQRSVEASA